MIETNVRGGALAFEGNSTIAIVNTTVASNMANSYTGDAGGGMGSEIAEGGGIVFYDTGSISVLNCTVAGNRAGSFESDLDTPDGGIASSYGGGVYFHGLGDVTVTNTIVAANSATDSVDVFNYAANSAFANSLVGNATGSNGISHNVDGNLAGTAASPIDARLAPLANNGGRTMTRALLSGSPAVDAGRASGAPTDDQRGVERS